MYQKAPREDFGIDIAILQTTVGRSDMNESVVELIFQNIHRKSRRGQGTKLKGE